jgi:hypothetical protein
MKQRRSPVHCNLRLCLLGLGAAVVAVGCGSVSPETALLSGESTVKVDFRTLGALPDTDNDGIPDVFDPAPENPDQDGDGTIDGYDPDILDDVLPYDPTEIDADTDKDGILDLLDSSPLEDDVDRDGVIDGLQTDSDGDGLVDALDHYPGLPDANCNAALDGEDPNYDNTMDYPSAIRGGEIVCSGGL